MNFNSGNKTLLFFTGAVISMAAWYSYAKPGEGKIYSSYSLKDIYEDSVTQDSTIKEKYKPSRRPVFKDKDRYGDEFSNTPNKKSPLLLGRPKNVKTDVQIDTSGEYYTVDEKLNGTDYRPGTTMSYKEYKKYQNRQAVKNYYRGKSKAGDEKEAAKNDKPRALVPRIYVSPNLDRIFGGNYIDVKMNGSVLLDLGYRIQSTNNPSLPITQRNYGSFFFDQQIAMNAQAKIGERLKITINQDTKSQFDFDNNVKLEYSSLETDIIQKIEAGNISMPLHTSLIQGAQNLFGIKSTMKFGHLTVTAVVANQRGRSQSVNVNGGSQGKTFSVRSDAYEDNRHYFLAQFFREHYESALSTIPNITSGVNITRIEVWITNRNNTTDALKNITAFMDLAEHSPFNNVAIQPSIVQNADNNANTLYRDLSSQITKGNGKRNSQNISFVLQEAPFNLQNGNDYEIIRNARKLKDTEFKFHPQLGYISLNTAVGRDDVVGVAYEYEYKGKSYQVGELSIDEANLNNQDVLFVKLLRPSTIRTQVPMWNLQMKNIYSLQATNLTREGFQLRVIYRDDRSQLNNPVINEPGATPWDIISDKGINGQPLIHVVGLDRLNMSNDPQPDGNFDFIDSPLSSAVQLNPAPSTQAPANQPNTANSNPASPTASSTNSNNYLSANRINAITIDPQAGRIIFPVLEPFGKTLKDKFGHDTIAHPEFIQKYIYEQLYTGTKSDALQLPNKSKFYIIGTYQGTSSDEIPIQGFGGQVNPQFVIVTANGQKLNEGTDYTVNTGSGTVKILNPAYLLPGQNVKVSYEQGDLFQVRTKTFEGGRLDYVLNKDIAFGGTILRLAERPLITRVPIGDEPLNNWIWGLDATYKKESILLTKMIDALPVISTKEKSTIQASGEFAQLNSNAANLVNKDGGTFFIDDFENTQVPFRLDNTPALNWRLASTPPGMEGAKYSTTNPLAFNDRRSKLAWYNVDNIFNLGSGGGGSYPGNLSDDDLKNHYVRFVIPQNLFPNQNAQQINLPEPIFNLAYYPNERGPYNYSFDNNSLDTGGHFKNPAYNWAGISRAVNNYDTDFDNANYQYLEFWMMDPFDKSQYGVVQDGVYNTHNTSGGKMLINLGSVSEDVIKDEQQEFEQGLPPDGLKPGPYVDKTPWGWVTNQQYITNSFSNEPNARQHQDIGLDGVNNIEEQVQFKNFIQQVNNSGVLSAKAKQAIINDPSSDDFKYFLGADEDASNEKVLQRYKSFNGVENNTPDNSNNATGINASNYTTPDNEDINQNNTLNDLEQFFQYEIDLNPNNMRVGKNNIINMITEDPDGQTDGGKGTRAINWYLFRIPLRENYTKYGDIENFKSIRFLRTYLTNWTQPVVLRTARMQLVASQWRPFTGDLTNKGLNQVIEQDDQVFSVSTVNIEENSQSTGAHTSPYVVPPGFIRDRDVNSTVPRVLNEHSLRLCVDNLPDQDARAVFKNLGGTSLINYQNVKMFVHGEADPRTTQNGDLTVFMRFGSDFTDNYYEIEMPLLLTQDYTSTDPLLVWLGEFNVPLDSLSAAKLQRDSQIGADFFSIFTAKIKGLSNNQVIHVRGNPQFTNVQTIMIGVRNPKTPDMTSKSACVWVDELRVTGIRPENGWAAIARTNMKLADLGTVSASYKESTPGFGALDQKISQRLLEDNTEYGVNANLAMDKFIPKNNKIGIKLPMYVNYDNKVITPQFNPLDPDVDLQRSLNNKFPNNSDPSQRQSYKRLVEDITTKKSISFNNVQKIKTNPKSKKHIYDVENLSLNASYTQTTRSNVNMALYDSRDYKIGIGYSYAPKIPVIEPLKNVGGFMKSPYLKLIKDINLVPFPNSIAVRGDLDRIITKTQYSNGINLATGTINTDGILPTFEKRFLFNRNYVVGWSITKSLAFNYNAQVNALIDEPPLGFSGYPNLASGKTKQDSIIENIKKGGRVKTFNQQVGVNYKLPLDKFPATNWLNADARYAAAYTFNAGPAYPLDSIKANPRLSLGSTVQNTNDITLNGKADLTKFYGKIKFLSRLNNPAVKPVAAPKDIKDTARIKKKPPPEFRGVKQILKFLMMVKSANLTYQITQGTVLPGYLGTPKYFGLDDHDGTLHTEFLPFILGSQNKAVFENPKFSNEYMSKSSLLTNEITQNKTENITGRVNIEPFKDFRIQLDAKVTNTMSYQELYLYKDTIGSAGFHSYTPYRTGTYNISFLAINTFFEPGGGINRFSPAFSTYETNRWELLGRLNHDNPNRSKGYFYDTSSQDVIIPAFIAAYTHKGASKINYSAFPSIPMPNWRIDYAGLPNIMPSIKKIFPSVSFSHSYSCTYSVNNYTTSLKYGGDTISIKNADKYYFASKTAPDTARYQPINAISSVTIIERFAPLIGINVKTKSNMTFRVQYNTDRSITLNISNRQITELRNSDVTIGYGYTKANMKLPIRYQGREIVLKNDITFRVDITRRESTTLQRIPDGLSNFTNGQVSFQIRPNISYQVNQRLTTQFYFEYTFNKSKTSGSSTRAATSFGIQIRYSLS